MALAIILAHGLKNLDFAVDNEYLFTPIGSIGLADREQVQLLKIQTKIQITTYSKRLKSQRLDFGAFQSCPILKRFGFQTFALPTGSKLNVQFSDNLLSYTVLATKEIFSYKMVKLFKPNGPNV